MINIINTFNSKIKNIIGLLLNHIRIPRVRARQGYSVNVIDNLESFQRKINVAIEITPSKPIELLYKIIIEHKELIYSPEKAIELLSPDGLPMGSPDGMPSGNETAQRQNRYNEYQWLINIIITELRTPNHGVVKKITERIKELINLSEQYQMALLAAKWTY